MSDNNQSDSTEIHTGGGAYIAGDVVTNGGTFIGRDQVIVHQYLDPADRRNQRNHADMRQLVKSAWVDGVLKQSLYRELLIRLNFKQQPNAVDSYLWDLILQQPGEPDNIVPHDVSIIDIFERMARRLLILGEPGSGKTTMLLELADELLMRAESDPTYPTPVIFNLSSWAIKRSPLADWLVEELRTRYRIPKAVANYWIENDELLPLLDGLDEVKAEYRHACVQAINEFLQEHMVWVAVCSRAAEYEDLTTRLMLHGAVKVQPLTLQQIDGYLAAAGTSLAGARTLLLRDAVLQDLAKSPLILSIISLTHEGLSETMSISGLSLQERRKELFDLYIRRMFVHRGLTKFYSIKQSLRWLVWLATCLIQQGQTTFLIERLQPQWLGATGFSKLGMYVTMLLAGPLYGLAFVIIHSVILGPIVTFLVRLYAGLLGEMHSYLLSGQYLAFAQSVLLLIRDGIAGSWQAVIIFGIPVGCAFGLLDALSGRLMLIDFGTKVSRLWGRIKSSLYAMVVWWLLGAIIVILNGQEFSLVNTLVGGGGVGLFGGLVGGFVELRIVRLTSLTIAKMKNNLLLGALNGFLVGLAILLIFSFALQDLGVIDPSSAIEGIIKPLAMYGLCGVISGLFLERNIEKQLTDTLNSKPQTQGIYTTAKYSALGSIFLILILCLATFVKNENAIMLAWLAGLIIAPCIGVTMGGNTVTKHFLVRLILWCKNSTPWNYARFLDYCHDRLFLRKVGGGYIFVHRLLMEHFASLTDEDIERIAEAVE